MEKLKEFKIKTIERKDVSMLQFTISKKLQKIINKINTQGEMSFSDAVTKEQIMFFEKKHNIKLPQGYKEWLLFSDGGEIFLPAGIQFYGIKHKPMIDINDNNRPCNNYIVIGALASGDSIVFKKNEECISIYNHANGQIKEDEIYEDFYAFLEDTYNLLGIED